MIKEYTAEDEMPDCGECDHICDAFDCRKLCGPKHGWAGYRRTEVIRQDTVPVIRINKKEVNNGSNRS